MRRSWRPAATFPVLVLVLLAACGDDTEEVDSGAPGAADTTTTIDVAATVPGSEPDLVGTITSVDSLEPVTEGCTPPEDLDPDGAVSSDDPPVCTPADADVVGTVLVEEDPDEPSAGRKISFTVTAQTSLVRDGQTLDLEDLEVGQVVEAWVSGDVCAESYPEQCSAAALQVTG